MPRTTTKLVQEALGNDYETGASLNRPISIANKITDRVATCATAKSKTLTTDELQEIETQLAAHYYTRTDRVYRQRMTDRASGTFLYNQRNPEPYLANAIELDYSGCVNSILNRKTADIGWLGKSDDEKIDYEDRN